MHTQSASYAVLSRGRTIVDPTASSPFCPVHLLST